MDTDKPKLKYWDLDYNVLGKPNNTEKPEITVTSARITKAYLDSKWWHRLWLSSFWLITAAAILFFFYVIVAVFPYLSELSDAVQFEVFAIVSGSFCVPFAYIWIYSWILWVVTGKKGPEKLL
jgi:hypothetical protein